MQLSILEHQGLDWDEGNRAKIEARVPLQTIESFFKQELLVMENFKHSSSESRFLGVGYTEDTNRCLLVIFTIRHKEGKLLIRPISARYTHRKEEIIYENEIKKLKENK